MSEHDPAIQGWQPLPTVHPDALTEARLQLHWAAQVLASIGYTHLQQADDDGQSNMGWVDGMQLLAGRYLDDEPTGFGSMTPAALKLAFHEPGGEEIVPIELRGRTLDEAYEAMESAIAERRNQPKQTLKRPSYDLPDHPVADGAKFGDATEAALKALHAWFHDANLVMRDLRAKTEGATLPRVWPHHFDMGMLISLEGHGDPQKGRSIGIGLSPGDDSDAAPYWYVAPYPTPDLGGDAPEPAVGEWTTQGFVGMKLDAVTAIGDGAGPGQESLAREFVGDAVAVCRRLLGT